MAFKKNKTKKGQIQVTFNWFYVLIAGGVILLFFFGIVMKQQKVSEENLAYDVVRIMESIFTGAGVSEKTKNFIDTSGLVDYTLYFNCDEGTTDFGIKEDKKIRKLTPVECERLQGFPDGWTEGVSDTQRYKCCGNAVTVPVVQWIASHFEFPKDLA